MLQLKVKTLEWFVKFANQDLENINEREKEDLFNKAEEFLSPKKEISKFLTAPIGSLRSINKWAYEVIEKESQRYWNIILKHQKKLRMFFDSYIIPTTHPTSYDTKKNPSAAPSSYFYGRETFVFRLTKGYRVPYQLEMLPLTRSRYDYVSLKVIRLLEGFSQHAIGVCAGCESYYFNPTRKIKKFCNDKRCMNRFNAKKRREKDPEGYRKKQRDRMYEKYEPKIGRRKRKYD